MDMRLQLVAIPVSDVDRAIGFYRDQIGFALDHDHRVTDELRFVQLTPPGSACSIVIGTGIPMAEPGSVRGVQVVVESVEEAHASLSAAGVEVSEIDDQPWSSFAYFADPDGNQLSVQQPTPRQTPAS